MAKNNFNYNDFLSDEIKQNIIDDYVNNYFSIKQLCTKYNVKSKTFIQTLLKGFIRNTSEANKVAHKKYPERYKHSIETKQKMSEKRLKFLKEHPEETAWRKRNKPSYPEECFIKYLQERGYDKKFLIEREKSVFPFYIDFAFIDIKLAVEIDGSQHFFNEERKLRDVEKNKLLKQQGWKVLRFTENVVKTDWELIDREIAEMLNTNKIYSQVGIIKQPKLSIKAERLENGLTQKQIDSHIAQRKVKNRPTKEELLKLIQNNSFSKIGKMFGVTDNTIRKWCKLYDLPFRKKDIEK